MKLVAVSQRIDTVSNRLEVRDSVDQRLNEFLIEAGYITVPVPNAISTHVVDQKILDCWIDRISFDGLVLTGGDDIGVYNIRDELEMKLIEHCFKNEIPVLGICRGLQVLAAWAGVGSVRVFGHVGERHELYGIIEGSVNSFHNFSIAQCPPNFNVIARALDEEIEAIKHCQLPWEGWMWHPEREQVFDSRDLRRLKELFN